MPKVSPHAFCSSIEQKQILFEKDVLGNDDEVDQFSECMNLHVGRQDSQKARTLEQTNKQLDNSKNN